MILINDGQFTEYSNWLLGHKQRQIDNLALDKKTISDKRKKISKSSMSTETFLSSAHNTVLYKTKPLMCYPKKPMQLSTMFHS